MIHAEQTDAVRESAINNFRAGLTWLLIATDLVGRGMDFLGVTTVVNYDFPMSTHDYVHRVGRTGRAGHPGNSEVSSGLVSLLKSDMLAQSQAVCRPIT